MNNEEIKKMSDQDIQSLKKLLDQEVSDRMLAKKAEDMDRFKELYNDARQDGISLGVSASNRDLLIAHSYADLYVGKWKF